MCASLRFASRVGASLRPQRRFPQPCNAPHPLLRRGAPCPRPCRWGLSHPAAHKATLRRTKQPDCPQINPTARRHTKQPTNQPCGAQSYPTQPDDAQSNPPSESSPSGRRKVNELINGINFFLVLLCALRFASRVESVPPCAPSGAFLSPAMLHTPSFVGARRARGRAAGGSPTLLPTKQRYGAQTNPSAHKATRLHDSAQSNPTAHKSTRLPTKRPDCAQVLSPRLRLGSG